MSDPLTPSEPTQTRLSSGWLHVRFTQECFAQIPPGFDGEEIPDEFIFHADGNRKRINDWWSRNA
jgi:hypothetical protein